jgi:hypothetical protein
VGGGLEAVPVEQAADAAFDEQFDLGELRLASRDQPFAHLQRPVLRVCAGRLAFRLLNRDASAGADVGAEAGGAAGVDRAEQARRLFLDDPAAGAETLADLLLELAVDFVQRPDQRAEALRAENLAGYVVLVKPPLALIVTFDSDRAPTLPLIGL